MRAATARHRAALLVGTLCVAALAAALSVAFGGLHSGAAATPGNICTWTNAAATNNISDNGNWTATAGTCGAGAGPGTASLSTAELVFPSPVVGAPSLDMNETVDDIVFQAGYTINTPGFAFTINPTANAGVGVNLTGGSAALNTAVTLGSNQTFQASGGGTLYFGAAITGAFGLTTIGTVSFQGSSTYSGGTTVSSGNLYLKVATSAGTASITVADGAQLNALSAAATTFANALILGTSAGGATLSDSSGVGDTWSGNITLVGSFDVISSSNTSFSVTGAVSGSAMLKASGTAPNDTTTLASTNTYSGGTTVLTGTLYMKVAGSCGAGAIVVDDNAVLAPELNPLGSITNTLTLGSSIGGASLQNYGVTGSAYSGNIILVGGVAGSDMIANNTASATFTVTGNISGTVSLNVGGAAGSIVALSGNDTYSGGTSLMAAPVTLKMNTATAYPSGGTLTMANGATFDLNGISVTIAALSGPGGTITNSAATAVTLTDAQSGYVTTYSGTITNAAGPLSFVMNGAGSHLTFTGGNSYTGTTTVQSGTFTLGVSNAAGATPITVDDAAFLALAPAATTTFTNPLTLGSSVGGATLDDACPCGDTYSGNITLVGSSGDNLNGAGTLNVTGTIGGAAGSGPLTVTGTGIVATSGANTYPGSTKVLTGATLNLLATTAASSGSITVNDGAILETTLPISGTLTNPLILGSSAGGSTLYDHTLAPYGATWNNTVTLVGASGDTFESNNTGFTVTGNISGTSLYSTATLGTNSVKLQTGVNTYTGSTTVSSGTLIIAGAGVYPAGSGLSISSGATFDMHGNSVSVGSLSGAGTIQTSTGNAILTDTQTTLSTFSGAIQLTTTLSPAIVMNGAGGDLILSGTSNFTGGITVQQGEVDLDTAAAGGTGAITANDNASVGLNTAGTTFSNALTLGSSAGGACFFDYSSPNPDTWAGTVNLVGTTTADHFSSSNTGFTISGVVSGAGSVKFDGSTSSGTTTLSGTNTYAGTTTVTVGYLGITKAGALPASSAVTVNDGAFLALNTTSPQTLTNALTLGSTTGNAVLVDDSASPDTWAGTVKLVGTTTADYVESANAGFVVTGTISGTALITATMLSSNAVVLAPATSNTYTGSTVISSGNLKLGVANAVPSTSSLTVSSGTTFDLATHAQKLAGVSGSGTVTTSSGTATLTVTAPGVDTYPGTISAGVSVTMAGSGNLDLTGLNTYTGATTVQSGGTVLLANASAAGSSAITVADGAGLVLQTSAKATFTNSVTLGSSAGGAILDDASPSADTYSGSITLVGASGDTLESNNAGFAVSGVVSGAAPLSTVGVAAANAVVLSGMSPGYSGSLTVVGGILTLTNSASPGTGGISVHDGAQLNLSTVTPQTFTNPLALGSSTGATLSDLSTSGDTWAGGITGPSAATVSLASSNGLFLVSGAIVGPVGVNLTSSGSNAVAFSGTNSYTKATTVSGVLKIASTGALPASTALSVNSGGVVDLDGFSPSVASLSGAGTVTSSMSGAKTLTDTQTTATNFSGIITNGGAGGTTAFTLNGTGGTLNMSGANTYTGATTVSAGTLNVIGSLASNVAVGSVGILEGNGSISGSVTTSSGSTVMAGTGSPGMLSVGGLTMSTGTSLDEVIQGSGLNISSSKLVVNSPGPVSLGGATLNVTYTTSAAVGTGFEILADNTGTAATGTLSVNGTAVLEGGTFAAGGTVFSLTYMGGTSGHDVVMTVASVPGTTKPTSSTSVSLTPSTAAASPGSKVTFTAAAVTSTTNNGATTSTPDANATVSFDVSSGPDAGLTGTSTTDSSGTATFSYTNNGTTGTDTVTALASGAGLASATVTFQAQYSLVLSPATQGQVDGTSATVTATLDDPTGKPVGAGTVSFTVSSGPDSGQTLTATTDSTGTAAFSVTASTAGTDNVAATYKPASGPTVTSNQATIKWAAPITIAPSSSGGTPTTPVLPGGLVTLSITLTSPSIVLPAIAHQEPAPPAFEIASIGTSPVVVVHLSGWDLVHLHVAVHDAPVNILVPHASQVPDVGVPVTFTVTSGPDSGKGSTVNTDATGTASWSYTNSGKAGTDSATATFTDSAGIPHTTSFTAVFGTPTTTTTAAPTTTTASPTTTAAPTTTASPATTTAPTTTASPATTAPPSGGNSGGNGGTAGGAPGGTGGGGTAGGPNGGAIAGGSGGSGSGGTAGGTGGSTGSATSPTTSANGSSATTTPGNSANAQSHALRHTSPSNTNHTSSPNTTLAEALGNNGQVVAVDGVTSNSNGATAPIAAVKALVAHGQPGPAMPYDRGYGIGANGGPTGPSPMSRAIPSITVALHNFKKTAPGNAGLAVLLLFLVGLPAMIFNAALREHHAKLVARRGAIRRAFSAVERGLENLHGAVLLGGFAVFGAVLYALDDPTFGLKLGSLAEIVGFMGAIVVSTVVTEVARGVYVHRRYNKIGDLKAFPLGLVIALVFDVFSRLSHFEPGYVFGILAAILFRQKPTGEEDGRSTTYAYLWLFVVAALSWVAYGPVNNAVIGGHHTFWLLSAESLLSYLWICGLQALFFSLIPARYMDGDVIFKWSKPIWAAIYAVVAFVFVQFVLHPTEAGFGGNSHTNLLPLLAIFIVSGVAAGVFWLYTHLKYGRRPNLQVVTEDMPLAG